MNATKKGIALRMAQRAVLTLLAISAAGCGSGGGSDSRLPNTIGPSGGTVASTIDRSASITFPAGLLAQDVTVTIEPGAPSSSSVLAPLAASQPRAYLLSLSAPGGREAHRNRSRSRGVVTFSSSSAGLASPERVVIVMTRANESSPVFFQPVFNPQTGQVSAAIPVELLQADTSLQSGAPLVSTATIEVASAPPPLANGPGWIALSRFERSPNSGQSGQWHSVSAWDPPAQPGERVAIIVPGTWDVIEDEPTTKLANYVANVRFAGDSDPVLFFDRVLGVTYSTLDAPFTNTGSLLAPHIKRLTDAGAKVYLFAHSQGGLVCRWALERAGAGDAVMLVMFGTPNGGVPVAAMETLAGVRMLSGTVPGVLDAAKGNPVGTTFMWSPGPLAMENKPLGRMSDELTLLNNNDPSHKSHTAYYTVCGDLTARSTTNLDALSGGEWPAHLLLVDGIDDGVSYEKSVRGDDYDPGAGFRLSDHTTAGYSHSITISAAHSYLPEVDDLAFERDVHNPGAGLRATISTWIRQVDNASVGININ